MKTIDLKFNNELISFERNQRDVMVNATQMAKVFGKDLFKILQKATMQKHLFLFV